MIDNQRVPLDRLVVAFSRTLDLVHPEMQEHQLRVAYISTCIARQMGFGRDDLLDLFLAASLHDIGMIRAGGGALDVSPGNAEEASWHPEIGYELLRNDPLLAGAAAIIRHHHVAWENGRGSESKGTPVPLIGETGQPMVSGGTET